MAESTIINELQARPLAEQAVRILAEQTAEIAAEKAANLAAEKAVQKVFEALGVDVTDKKSVAQLRRNLEDLGDWCDTQAYLKRKGIAAVLLALITGLISMAVLGVTTFFHNH